jgi:hypothetical protein
MALPKLGKPFNHKVHGHEDAEYASDQMEGAASRHSGPGGVAHEGFARLAFDMGGDRLMVNLRPIRGRDAVPPSQTVMARR